MNYFLKANKNIITYSLLLIIFIPLFGINFFVNVLSNILLLLFLIPFLLLLFVFIVWNSFKSKINKCNQCGAIELGFNEQCMNCGADLKNISEENLNNPSESTIEVKAEEIK